MRFNYRNAHVRDFCHGISLRTLRESGAYGVSRRTAAADCLSGIPRGTARGESSGANHPRQAQSPRATRHEPQPRFVSLQRNASHRRRLSANSQRNTGVFNDLPGSMQTISGHPLTGRKPDNSIPSLLLSDPAVLFSPPGFSFSSHNQLRDAIHRNQPRNPFLEPVTAKGQSTQPFWDARQP